MNEFVFDYSRPPRRLIALAIALAGLIGGMTRLAHAADAPLTAPSTAPAASAILAVEAFKLCGDHKAFADQLTDLAPWQPIRILQNGRGGGAIVLDIGGNDPLSGEPFGKLAGRSRSMHKTQGFGNFTGGGGPG